MFLTKEKYLINTLRDFKETLDKARNDYILQVLNVYQFKAKPERALTKHMK